MSDILDLIDNAIEAHEVSPDAMRWTPEAPKATDAAGPRIGGFISDEHWNAAVRLRWAAALSEEVIVQRPDGSAIRFRCRLVPSGLSRENGQGAGS